MMAGGCCVGVVRLDSWAALSLVPGAWSVSCADWRSDGWIVDVLCFVFLGGTRGLWLCLCKHRQYLMEI